MTTAVRSYLMTGMALMGAGLVTAAQITPPLHQAETRVVQAAVTLAAAVGNGQPCSGYNTDGCDINAPVTYTPLVLDQSGSPANIAANILNLVAGVPRAVVDAVNELSYALEVTGNWWVYSSTNVLGFDPADPPKITALVDLLIPFKPISHATGEQLAWWGRSNLTMNEGCTADVGPHCTDLEALLSTMFLAPIWKLAAGYQFGKLFNPVSAEETAIGNEIPGSVGAELPWSEAYVKLDLLDPAYALINYLQADPSSNTPTPVTPTDVVVTLDRLRKALKLGFNAFVPMSFLLKGWPYTALTPLFKPFVPLLCPTCNPVDPGLPPVPVPDAAATVVSAQESVDEAAPEAPAVSPVAAAKTASVEAGEPGDAKPDKAPVANAVAAIDAEAVAGSAATADVPSEPVSKPRRGQHTGTRASTAAPAAAAATDQGASPAKARVRAAASGE